MCVGVEQVRGVDALEIAERAEQADADVDGAVADGEDPAVPGQRVAVAVVHVERGFDPWLVVARALPVGPDGGAVRPLACAERAERATEAAVGAVGHHDVLGMDVERGPVLHLHRRAAHEPAIHQRLHGLVPGEQRGAFALSVQRHHGVELAAADDVPVLRVHRMAGPFQFERLAHAHRSQAAVAVERTERFGEPHLVELMHGPRREAVAARLLTRERLAFDDGDVVAVACQPVAGCRPAGPPPMTSTSVACGASPVGASVLKAASGTENKCGRFRTEAATPSSMKFLAGARREVQASAVVPATGTLPMGMMPRSGNTSWRFSKVAEPSWRAAKMGDSSEHHSSNSTPSSGTPASA
jgi:hypothetical protein